MEKNIEYGMVDLGLSVKWADRNIGAENPEAIGDYFMWGSVTPDTDNVCDWAHAPFNDGQEDYDEEYFNEHKSERLDGDVLKTEYDAAHAAMGGSWRMPTSAEMQELIDGTTQTVEGNGMRFTSKANGNSIFMPFCGGRDGSDVDYVCDLGLAWSSSLDAGEADGSHYIIFDDGGGAGVHVNSRCYGFVVRAVC